MLVVGLKMYIDRVRPRLKKMLGEQLPSAIKQRVNVWLTVTAKAISCFEDGWVVLLLWILLTTE